GDGKRVEGNFTHATDCEASPPAYQAAASRLAVAICCRGVYADVTSREESTGRPGFRLTRALVRSIYDACGGATRRGGLTGLHEGLFPVSRSLSEHRHLG